MVRMNFGPVPFSELNNSKTLGGKGESDSQVKFEEIED